MPTLLDSGQSRVDPIAQALLRPVSFSQPQQREDNGGNIDTGVARKLIEALLDKGPSLDNNPILDFTDIAGNAVDPSNGFLGNNPIMDFTDVAGNAVNPIFGVPGNNPIMDFIGPGGNSVNPITGATTPGLGSALGATALGVGGTLALQSGGPIQQGLSSLIGGGQIGPSGPKTQRIGDHLIVTADYLGEPNSAFGPMPAGTILGPDNQPTGLLPPEQLNRLVALSNSSSDASQVRLDQNLNQIGQQHGLLSDSPNPLLSSQINDRLLNGN